MFRNNHSFRGFMILIFILPLLSGCWDSREIDMRANVLSIGIDEVENQNYINEEDVAHYKNNFPIPNKEMIKLTAQIAIPGRIPLGPEQTGGTEKPVLIISVMGHTIEDALNNLQQEVAEKLFLGHLRILVLNEKVAKKGTQRFNDFLRRNPEIRRTAALVVSKEPAVTFLKMAPKLERIPSLYLADMVDSLAELGKFPPSFIGLFWTILSSDGQEAYLPYLNLISGKNIQLNGLAYFRGDKMVGKTLPLEIGLYMSVRGIHKGGYDAFVEVPGTNKLAVYRTMSRISRIKVNFQDGKPHAKINISYESQINEKENPEISISSSKLLKEIEKEASKDVESSTSKLIKKTQKAKSDVFGFGEYFRANYPRFWNTKIKTKDKWEDYYQELTYDIHVETHLHRVGMKAR